MTRVLIVDDKEENLYYLQALLEGHGFAVEAARHGAEALVKARNAPPDVVISDLLMPVMDGYTLLRHWKADPRLRQVPFIVYTATYTEAEDERLALSLGADAFILKPSEPDDFIGRLNQVRAGAGTSRPELPQPPEGDESAVLKYYSQTLIRKLEDKTLQLEEANRALQLELSERKSMEGEISFKNMLLETQQDASLDAILVVGENDQILSYNRKFIDMWGLPAEMVNARQDGLVLQFNADQAADSEAFLAGVKHLFADRNKKDRDEILLKDGRIIDRYSAPMIGAMGKYFGRVWYFRDITESRRAQQSLQASEREQRQLARQLEAERARLVAAQRVAKVGSWETDLATLTVIWSDETYRIFEADPASFRPTHQGFLEFVHPEDRAAVDEAFARSTDSQTACAIEHRILFPDGRIKFLEENWQVVFDDGKPVQAIGTCQDITERKIAENGINRLNRVLTFLSQINTLIVRVQNRQELVGEACRIAAEAGSFRMSMIVIVDKDTRLPVLVESAGKDEKLLESIKDVMSTNEGMEKTMVALAIRDKKAVISNNIQNDSKPLFGKHYLEAGVNSMVVLPLIISGEAVGVIALYAAEAEFFHDDEMKLLNELANDIAFAIDHIDKQELLNYLAYYDVLTGLANRSLFLERVGQFMRSAEGNGHQLAIGLIDLERFKNINDSLGRPAGDALLKQMAEWLTRFAQNAGLLARIDADHFAFVVPEVKSDGNLARLVENVMEALLEHPFHLGGHAPFRISVKVGIALFPDDGADTETVFGNAEAALKAAKKSGNRYLFHTKKMTEAIAAKLTLENQLRQAIDNEEFVLHYQPKLNLMTGKVTGAEALIRWNDPRTGLVAPGKFIPILEETGLISEVGRWALRRAVTDYLRWRDAGLEAVRIAVNVSSMQLRNPGFVAEIERKVSIDPHAAEGLELEITESMIMEDMQHTVSSLHAIHKMGVAIAIDDFGTGFSSLGYLSKLPADTLKIDRSFVLNMTDNPEGLALVSTIVNLAHSLKLKVVAEGVETQEQSNLLRLLNCDEMQGFLFSKPVPVDIFEARFLSQI